MRFLVVDDELVALAKMSTILKEFGECDKAVSGKEAMELFISAIEDKKVYDLITIDLEMPEMSGFELLELMNEKEKKMKVARTKKFIVTAEGTMNNVKKAVAEQCDSFIIKPVKKDTLIDKLIDHEII